MNDQRNVTVPFEDDLSEMWREARKDMQERRRKIGADNLEWLQKTGALFNFDYGNGQAVITTVYGSVDYWTTTNRWFIRKQHRYGRGHKGLKRVIKGEFK